MMARATFPFILPFAASVSGRKFTKIFAAVPRRFTPPGQCETEKTQFFVNQYTFIYRDNVFERTRIINKPVFVRIVTVALSLPVL